MTVRGLLCAIVIATAATACLLPASESDARDGHPRGQARPWFLGPQGGGSGWMRSRPRRQSIVWAVGDAADGSPTSRDVAAMVGSNRVDRFLYLGDVYAAGSAQDFSANYQPIYGFLGGRTAPTIGNHEWPNVSSGYLPYWTAAHGAPPPFWYAFAVSGWQL